MRNKRRTESDGVESQGGTSLSPRLALSRQQLYPAKFPKTASKRRSISTSCTATFLLDRASRGDAGVSHHDIVVVIIYNVDTISIRIRQDSTQVTIMQV